MGGVNNWERAAPYFWPVLYDGEFAQSIGMDSPIFSGTLLSAAQAGNTSKYADILRTIIAYSAIDEGADAARPFGDTAIRALYDDANDLGSAIIEAGVGSSLETIATNISKFFVHFSGRLASYDIEQQDHPETLEGVLTYNNTSSNKSLEVDLTNAAWTNIFGSTFGLSQARDDFLYETVRKTMGMPADSAFSTGSSFWSPLISVNHDYAILGVGNDKTAHMTINPDSTKKPLFIGSNGNENIVQTALDDIIIGGGGFDAVDCSTQTGSIDVTVNYNGDVTAITPTNGTDTLLQVEGIHANDAYQNTLTINTDTSIVSGQNILIADQLSGSQNSTLQTQGIQNISAGHIVFRSNPRTR